MNIKLPDDMSEKMKYELELDFIAFGECFYKIGAPKSTGTKAKEYERIPVEEIYKIKSE